MDNKNPQDSANKNPQKTDQTTRPILIPEEEKPATQADITPLTNADNSEKETPSKTEEAKTNDNGQGHKGEETLKRERTANLDQKTSPPHPSIPPNEPPPPIPAIKANEKGKTQKLDTNPKSPFGEKTQEIQDSTANKQNIKPQQTSLGQEQDKEKTDSKSVEEGLPPVISPPPPFWQKKKFIGGAIIAILLAVAIPAGVFLTRQQLEIRRQATQGCTDQALISQAGEIVTAVDGQSLATQPCSIVASFVSVHSSNAGKIWAREHNLELAGEIAVANDGQTLRDQTDEVIALFVREYKDQAGRVWAEQHNKEIAKPTTTPAPQPTIVQPLPAPDCPKISEAGKIWQAVDGQSLADQECSVIETFVAQYGENAGARWATEHNLELGCGKADSCPQSSDGQSLATQDPAIIASFVSQWWQQLGNQTGFRWMLEHNLEITCPSVVAAKDGQTLRDQSNDVISSFLESYGADACQRWADEHNQEISGGATAQCKGVFAYDLNDNRLTSDQLSQLKGGDVIRVVVSASPAGPFTKARFRFCRDGVCPNTWDETTKTNQNGFYKEYTIPSGGQTFRVQAQLWHSSLGRWF